MTGRMRRMRRELTRTAAAATAMVALTGSQGPGLTPVRAAAPGRAAVTAPEQEMPGDAYYRHELPPLRVRGLPASADDAGAGRAAAYGAGRGAAVPATVFDAYRKAEAALARSAPGCGLRWQLLAAIGQVESGQARGGRTGTDGTTTAPIVGPQLNGRHFALIRDTDKGAYDGDVTYDRAVGPMQFIPSTWARWGADGNGDGRADPHNVYDAALAAGRYLCAGGRRLALPGDLERAVLAYNRSREYLRVVLAWYAYFADGHRVVRGRGGAGSSGAKAAPRPAERRPESRVGPEPTRAAPAPRPSRSPSPAATATASPSPAASRPADAGETGPLPGTAAVPVPEVPDDGLLPSAVGLGPVG
ncbi:lytic murein transglycosylase [Streptomyces sp. HNM0663]|uniref:Lytic murein transglycosylase n=1 Tax=Streptomyces chengmaiensis TaxID=3040919 RepID=A0ABT6HRD7_9ACTN|nr:lytic transglycosylase domain-containing protein [Streptomyces chengmaiensis]MDH2390886.1 lytic murein transglycosylase [Streptomyces chengmaiensis]